MILIIAEKPSLGRAIAAAIPGRHRNLDGYIELADGNLVSWCIGHLLEQAEPQAYDPSFKVWRLDDLPIIPATWQLTPKPQTRKQLQTLKSLIKQAAGLVNAGDPDREGQLLVDEVIEWAGVSAAKRQSTRRLLINDLNPEAVRVALANQRPNSEFASLSRSALARSRADWLYGINLTRAYTLQGRQAGYQGVLSVGRVQTPVLGLVVNRDLDIEQFRSHPFYEVWAHLLTGDGEEFQARWLPSESCQPYLDEEGRNLSRPLADNVASRIRNQPAIVEKFSQRDKPQPPPLPHSLSSLQMEANKVLGLTAKQVLDICQQLYEQHKVITYPRSDCRYLPKGHHAQAPAVCDAIFGYLAADSLLQGARSQLELARRSSAWNDSKVDAHHAIIPTPAAGARLNPRERQVYELIARHYLAQFLPAAVSDERKASVRIGTGEFLASSNQLRVSGWKILFPVAARQAPEVSAVLPDLHPGQVLQCPQAEVREKQTTPPKAFTEASLLAAMTGIARYVTDAELRKVLKDTDGLGTEATRAGIIELLCHRQFLERQGKLLRSTASGRALIAGLPTAATTPDMTAKWESLLGDISAGQAAYDDLMQPLQAQLAAMIEHCRLSPESFCGNFTGIRAPAAGKARRYAKTRGKGRAAASAKAGAAKSGSKTGRKSVNSATSKAARPTKSVKAKPATKPVT